jgi:hypothetical protein
MDMKSKLQKGRATNPFTKASKLSSDPILELVKHLARISAENDYNKLTETSSLPYNALSKKGPSHD